MQGARIGKNAYLDSLDFSDFDLINIGDDVAVNEGATLLGHYFKDGLLHFGEVHFVTRFLVFHPVCVACCAVKTRLCTCCECQLMSSV